MDLRQRTNRFGIFVILCACILRLGLTGMPETARTGLTKLKSRFLPTYSETGRNVRFSVSSGEKFPHFRESSPPRMPEGQRPRFSREDAAAVEMDYDCPRRPDLEELMARPLDWDLTGPEPSVLILHTHTTESYTQEGGAYTPAGQYRTLEEEHNMLSIGDAVTKSLTRAGIGVIHDREIHDYPSYSDAYIHSRQETQTLLSQYPSIRLVLDLHRDALETAGGQLRPLTESAEGACAQMMLVVGTDVSRGSHENWQENLALALKFQVQLERQRPGIMRPMNLRSQRFNQDLSPGALLVEVGAAGNTRAEALRAARELAEAILALAGGADTA